MSDLFNFTFNKQISRYCKHGKIYVFQRAPGHFEVFSREVVTDFSAIDAINAWIIRHGASAAEQPSEES